VGDAAADGIGGQWTATIRSAAKAAAARLPDALDQAVAATDLQADRRPRWWSVANAVQWVAVIAAVVGGLWLLGLAVVGYLRLPEVPTPEVGSVPVPTLLFLGGILLGVGLAVVCMFAARVGGRRRAAEVRQRLRKSVGEAADEVVVKPVTAEVDRYRAFRQAAIVARG
jgi:hypothetical protein